MMNAFEKLNDRVYLCFTHNTHVPGLSDYIKHIDAFSNLCFDLGVGCLIGGDNNVSRSVVDDVDIVSGVGLNDSINELSRNTVLSLKQKKNIFNVNLDFNKIVSGQENAILGFESTSIWSYEQRIEFIKNSIVEKIVSEFNIVYKKSVLSIDDVLQDSDFSWDAINFNFNVVGMSLILRFLKPNSVYFNILKDISISKIFFLEKNEPDILNVTFHLRRGDISIFNLRDKYIACWGDYRRSIKNPSSPQIIDNIENSIYKYYHIVPYIELLKRIGRSTNKKLNLYFLCDGFERGVERIKFHSDTLNITNEELKDIGNQAEFKKKFYIEEIESLLNDGFESVAVYFGETGDLFFKSLSAIARSHIFLCSAGGFGKTIFQYYNIHKNSIILGPCVQDSIEKDMLLLSNIL